MKGRLAVYIDAVEDYDLGKIRTAVERGMADIGISFTGAKTAVIKPNIVQAKSAEAGVVTHPLVVEAIVDALYDRGVKNITIAEAPALGVDAHEAFQAAGYAELAKRKKLDLVNLFNAPRTKVSKGFGYKNLPNLYKEEDLQKYHCGYMEIPSVILESDIYINVGKLKTHNRTKVSMTMKNQWGLLSFKDRQMYHNIGLHEPITQLANAVQPDMTVVDGILGMEGNGPILGTPKKVGAIIVGQGMVETDIVGCKMLGQDPQKVIHLRRAVELGLGTWDVDLRGVPMESLATVFEPAPLDVKRTHNFYLWRNHRACHLDDDAFHLAVKMAKKNPKYWRFLFKLAYWSYVNRLDVVRGRGNKMPEFKPNQRIIVSGECARDLIENYEELPKNIVFLPGCPPDPEEIIKAIIKM